MHCERRNDRRQLCLALILVRYALRELANSYVLRGVISKRLSHSGSFSSTVSKFLYIPFHEFSCKFTIHDAVRVRNNYCIFKILIHSKKYEYRSNIIRCLYISDHVRLDTNICGFISSGYELTLYC